MNLLKKPKQEEDKDHYVLSNFREFQYSLIDYFMNVIINYVSKQNKNYLKVHSVNLADLQTYMGVSTSLLSQVIVKVTDSNNITNTFFKFLIPSLVEDAFFLLNGSYYIPTVYILDKPIVVKKESIKLTGTFNSITIYDKLITFIGTNIPASYFLDLFLSDQDLEQKSIKDEFINIFRITPITISEQDLLNYFGSQFKVDPTRDSIKDYFESLFFDEYSKLLYQSCYNLSESEINISKILQLAIEIKKSMEDDSFIDLRYKRLVFLEVLLAPLFKRIAIVATKVARGFFTNELNMDQMELIKYFHIDLHNKFIYDNVNAYDIMLQHKAFFLNPNAETAPSVIANLHPTHFRNICPISVSSQNPGETIFITTEAKFDSYGQFVNLGGE